MVTVTVPGLAAARACGDKSATAGLLNNLGAAYLKLGRIAQAADCLRQSLEISRKLGDDLGQAMALANLGLLELGSGLAESAIRRFTDALAINMRARRRDRAG